MVYNGNTIRRVFEIMSPKGLSSLDTRMKVSSPNCYNFKKPLILAQTIRSSHNSVYFKNLFLMILTDSCFDYKSVSYNMVYKPCFEEVYLDIRNQSGCLRVTSFLKAGLYCIYHCRFTLTASNVCNVFILAILHEQMYGKF